MVKGRLSPECSAMLCVSLAGKDNGFHVLVIGPCRGPDLGKQNTSDGSHANSKRVEKHSSRIILPNAVHEGHLERSPKGVAEIASLSMHLLCGNTWRHKLIGSGDRFYFHKRGFRRERSNTNTSYCWT